MLHLRSVLLLLLVASQAFGISQISRRTTHAAGQILTESDLNLDNDHLITAINLMIAKFPGDSVRVTMAAMDTLVSDTSIKVVVKAYLIADSAGDSLVFQNARIDTIHGDTLRYARGFIDTLQADSLSVTEIGVTRAIVTGELTVDGTLNSDGPVTVALAPVFAGGATFSNGLKVSGGTAVFTGAKAVFTAATSVLLPTALTFASSTDGHVLTADGSGRVALEAIPTGAADVDSTLAAAGTSTVKVRTTVAGVTIVNQLQGTLAATFSGGASFTNGLQVDGTLNVDGPVTIALAPVFSGGATFNSVDINGGAVDGATVGAASHTTGKFTTLTATGGLFSTLSATFSGGASFANGLQVDGTLNSDGPATFALAPVFSGGASFTSGLQVDGALNSDGPVTFALAPVFSGGATINSATITSADINGGSLDGATVGAASHATGKFTVLTATGGLFSTLSATFSGGASFTNGLQVDKTLNVDGPVTVALAPVFAGGATFSAGLKATGGKAVFSSASSVLLPTALTMPSGTDGHVLTSDGTGRVILEAVPTASVDVDSALVAAGTSTVKVRTTVAGVTVVNQLLGTLAATFSGGASFTNGLQVDGTLNSDGPVTFALAPVFSGGASFTNGLQVDKTLNVDGPVTVALAPVFAGGATFSAGLKATGGKAVFSSAASVLLPTAITMPSGTDGHVLTSDGTGRVILEAIPTGAVDVDSALVAAGTSTVKVRTTTAGITIVNQLLGTLAATFSGGASFTNGLQVDGTLNVDGPVTFAIAPVFSGGATFNSVDINGGAVDGATVGAASHTTGKFTTLTATGGLFSTLSATFSGGASFANGLQVDGTLNVDGPATFAIAPVFSGGASFTSATVTGMLNSDGPVTFALAPVFSGGATINSATITSADINGGSLDGATVGAASHTTGKFTVLTATGGLFSTLSATFSGGASFANGLQVDGTLNVDGPVAVDLAPVFAGGATFSDGLKVSGGTAVVASGAKAVFTAATSVLLPTALTFASSTDGHVLTADGHGRVALEAIPTGAVDVDSTLTAAGTSTVKVRTTVAGVTIINQLQGTLAATFSGGASFTSGLQVDGTLDVDGPVTVALAPVFSGGLTVNSISGDAIGTDVQAYDADLDDLADGSLSGSKVGSGIPAGNITTGSIPIARITGVDGSGSGLDADLLDGTSSAGFQTADADLTDLADGSLSGSKVGSGIPGGNITTGNIPIARITSTDGSGSGLDADLLDSYNASDGTSGNTIALRDASGRLQSADPTTAQEVVTKAYFEANAGGTKYWYYTSGSSYTGGTADDAAGSGEHMCFTGEWLGRSYDDAKGGPPGYDKAWFDTDTDNVYLDCNNWTSTASTGAYGHQVDGIGPGGSADGQDGTGFRIWYGAAHTYCNQARRVIICED